MKKTLMARTKNLKTNIFTTADQVRIGDNVWGHNIVQSISRVRDHITCSEYVLFNGGSAASAWFAKPKAEVMITGRIPNKNV